MAPRRGAPSSNTLSPQEPPTPSGSSPAFLGFPRSNSPSSGFTQFLSKPSKWFRSTSSPRSSSGTAEQRPRTSTGSTARKHKISRPTDPRPILDSYPASGSRSVLDLSARPPTSLDIAHFHPPSSPSSPTTSPASPGLGDLRNMSRRGWSKSADDLGKVSPGNFSPIDTNFQDKIAQYRNRSDSNASGVSPSSPSSPGSFTTGRQPFPTIKTTSPPSSPPRSSTLTPASTSISAPTVGETTSLPNPLPQQVHTRSHSFTPKLSSKLATPRFGPPSPKRQGSGASEKDMESRDVDKLGGGGSSGMASPTRGGFPFSFAGINHKPLPPDPIVNHATPSQIAPRTTLLAPPIIIEPGQVDVDSPNTKRSSQIVYHSGFINRLADVPNHFHHTNLALAKGWKPFKLELKGSKLFFYKPPGDRNAAVKELFPTAFVPASQEDEEVDEGSVDELGRPRKGKVKEHEQGTFGRKKRAFWGRRTHPDLVQDVRGKIETGTFEALVHEAVFATTFFDSRVTPDEEQGGEDEGAVNGRREEWKDFASAILLCLPSLAGRAKFETEFTRCCAYFVSGAEESTKQDARTRVGWLAGEYLRCHGEPADLPAWEEWRVDTIPEISSAIVQTASLVGMPTSSSMQALYLPSPLLGSGSPNLGTFSPRPEDGAKLASLMEALGGHEGIPPSFSGKQSLDFRTLAEQQTLRPAFVHTRMPWTALEREGLSRDVLLSLDSHLIARSLTSFHRSVLEQTPDNLTAEFVMGSDSVANSSLNPTSSENDGLNHSAPSFSPLFGSEEHPHWLTKLLLMQILGADTSTGKAASPHLSSPGRNPDDRNVHTSRTHSRSQVISVWAKVGELCRLAGDECSWQAIAAGLCSRPVARLDKAWKRVDSAALAAAESWVYPAADGELVSVKEPKVTPWGGDIKSRIKEELGKAAVEHGQEVWRMHHLEKARAMFEDFRTSFSLCPKKMNLIDSEMGEDVRRMVAYWHDMSAEGGGSGGLAAKFMRVEQFMSLSVAAESRRKGLFEPYYWSRSLSTHSPQTSLIPLLFPEPLPTVSLIDRAQVLRGRVDSDATDVQLLRGIDAHLRPEELRNMRRPDGYRDISKGLANVGRGGTVIPVYDGDLLLIVQTGGAESTGSSRSPSRTPSRPPSSVVDPASAEKTLNRTPSIRVKPGASQGLDRKTSVARRSSLPSVSHRQNFMISEPSSEPPLRVLVQAGTLDCLVNILVHGLQNVSVSVADDNGEMSLREGMTRELVVDHTEFASVWWNVFRSFVTPLVFFELLRKLYIRSQPPGSSPSVSDYLRVAGSRSEVLETMKEWVSRGGGAQDALDDVQLFNVMQSFLESPTDHAVHESTNFEDSNVRQAWTALSQAKRSLRFSFASATKRPLPSGTDPLPKPAATNANGTRGPSSREPPDIDLVSAEQLVDNLDGMACAAFSNVTQEDLFITSDLLEVQTADNMGWFLHRELVSMEEVTEIQTMYSHVQEVEPSSMISELGQDAIYRLLPPGIRSCIRAYGILRKWVISKIVAPRLGIRDRQTRMELLLQAIEVARLRNTETTFHPGFVDRPCIRSLVEAVITSAILSIESRLHHRAWQNVALRRGSQCDSLLSLLSKPNVSSTTSKGPLTVDMGWLIERLLELIATPDVVESSAQGGQNLVNFDKRRHLCTLIANASSLPSSRRPHQRDETNRRGFERLSSIEKEVSVLQFDQRGIKEEAQREGAQAAVNGTVSTRRVTRPFQKTVVSQIEKNRRDKNLRTRLQKEKVHAQSRNEKREDLLNKAMRPRKPGATLQKQHRNKKSMSAFLQFMRPISSAFGAEIPHPPGLKKSASELDFAPSGKPSLVISLVDAQVAQFINNERSFTFQIDSEDGGHYLLQAMNKRDMTKWMDTIHQVTKTAAKRRLTYLGNSPKPQLSDHIHNHPLTPSQDPMAVFGVELEFLLRREAGNEDVRPGAIPSVVERCLLEVESRGLSEVGIYRIAGASSEINALKDAFNRGEAPIDKSTDIHAVCDLVKSWFRVLPEPVFPSSSYYDIIQAMKLENLDSRLSLIRGVVQSLPQANFDLLKRVSEHLDRVTDYEEHNQMTAEALAIVFSPNLLRAPQNDFVMILANMGHTHKLVKALITHFHVIFDDVDPEAEVDQEDDFDSPILEEDEEDEEEDEVDLQPPLTHGSELPLDYGQHNYTPN